MCYEVLFDLVDADTGEILTLNKRTTITTECLDVPSVLSSYLACFYRGLCKGRSLVLQLSAVEFKPPKQLDLF